MKRRTFVVGVAMAAIAGCTGDTDDEEDEEYQEPEEEPEEADAGAEEPEGDEDEEEELPDEEEVEQREEQTDVLEFGDLEIIEYEEEIEERSIGDRINIVGVVENHDEDTYDSVSVSVRAYDEDGHQMDVYSDRTRDLQGDGTWAFEVSIREDADDVDDWDIAVTGRQR